MDIVYQEGGGYVGEGLSLQDLARNDHARRRAVERHLDIQSGGRVFVEQLKDVRIEELNAQITCLTGEPVDGKGLKEDEENECKVQMSEVHTRRIH